MDNGRAVRLARRLDGAPHFDGGVAEARIEPPWPTPWTWLEELLCDAGLYALDDLDSDAAARRSCSRRPQPAR